MAHPLLKDRGSILLPVLDAGGELLRPSRVTVAISRFLRSMVPAKSGIFRRRAMQGNTGESTVSPEHQRRFRAISPMEFNS
jgi:hypothetical protein